MDFFFIEARVVWSNIVTEHIEWIVRYLDLIAF